MAIERTRRCLGAQNLKVRPAWTHSVMNLANFLAKNDKSFNEFGGWMGVVEATIIIRMHQTVAIWFGDSE